jgi:hypothetical protein
MAAMTLTINLPIETEDQLRAAAARRGCTLEDYVTHLVISSTVNGIALSPEKSTEDWIAEWRTWAASHAALPQPADDSRESIYEGRGE